ncbi:MAG: hypothetical protein ABW024_03110 [Microbacterium sp.]
MAAAAPFAGFALAPRVNLMPRAETERRARSLLARRWSLAVLVALVLVAAASAFAFSMQIAAAARLAAENARTSALLGELAALSDVRDALALEDELETFRADAMATDVDWLPLLTRLQPAFPPEAAVVGFRLAPGGIPVGDDPAAEMGVVGTLTVISATLDDVTSVVRAIRPMEGVREIDGWSTLFENGYYRHELRIALDQTLYTGAYSSEEAAG